MQAEPPIDGLGEMCAARDARGAGLVERIARRISSGGAPLDAATIAAEFLHLANAHSAASRTLVRAVLAGDGRFVESSPGAWSLAAPPELTLPVLLCRVEIPPAAAREPWLWQVSGALWGSPRMQVARCGAPGDSDGGDLLSWLQRYPIATERAGALGQWLRVQERLHGFPEPAGPVIDLRAWQRWLPGVAGPAEATSSAAPPDPRERYATPEEHFAALGPLMDALCEVARRRGWLSWSQLAEVTSAARDEAEERFWAEPRELTRAAIDGLPAEPGVYRFFDRAGALLYVGKAKDLRRRVQAHFRPLPPPRSARETQLRAVHRMEVARTGTELEALLREAREIRARRPAWNIQLDLGPETEHFPAGERELLLILRDAAGGGVLLALQGVRAALAPLRAFAAPRELEEALRGFYTTPQTPRPLQELLAPERALARRYAKWPAPAAARLRLADFATYRGLADAVTRWAEDGGAAEVAGEALVVREAPQRGAPLESSRSRRERG